MTTRGSGPIGPWLAVALVAATAVTASAALERCPGAASTVTPTHVIRLLHPVTGVVVYCAERDSLSGAKAVQTSYRQYRWRVWRLVGINEPTHSKQFGHETQARAYQIPVPLLRVLEYERVTPGTVTIVDADSDRAWKTVVYQAAYAIDKRLAGADAAAALGAALKNAGVLSGTVRVELREDFGPDALTFFVAWDEQTAIVGFRGVHNDWNKLLFSRAHATDGRHAGVYGALVNRTPSSLAPYQEVTKLLTRAGALGGQKMVLVTGHSLGGMLAGYTSYELMTRSKLPHALVTFGAPRYTTKELLADYSLRAGHLGVQAYTVENRYDSTMSWTPAMYHYTLGQPVTYSFSQGDPHDMHLYYLQAATAYSASHGTGR
jgi:hypothetical protein